MNQNDPFEKKPERLGVFNPLKEDFSVNYDIHGNAQPETFVVPSQEIVYFPYALGEHVKKHLADAVMNARDLSPLIAKNREEVLAEISV